MAMTQWGLDSLFNPAKRHMDEEKRRLQATREEIGDSSGGKRIDLESGKVKIRKANGKATVVSVAEVEADKSDGETDVETAEVQDTDPETADATANSEKVPNTDQAQSAD